MVEINRPAAGAESFADGVTQRQGAERLTQVFLDAQEFFPAEMPAGKPLHSNGESFILLVLNRLAGCLFSYPDHPDQAAGDVGQEDRV